MFRNTNLCNPYFVSKKSLNHFSITNPKRVVFLGYYGYDNLYAALLAANNLGITTVDFQHGPQTNVHMAFSSWSKVPEGGYN